MPARLTRHGRSRSRRSPCRARLLGLAQQLGLIAPFGLVALLGLTAACTSEDTCPAGSERCACYANSTCNAGLACLSDHCVDLGLTLNRADGGERSHSNTEADTLQSDSPTMQREVFDASAASDSTRMAMSDAGAGASTFTDDVSAPSLSTGASTASATGNTPSTMDTADSSVGSNESSAAQTASSTQDTTRGETSETLSTNTSSSTDPSTSGTSSESPQPIPALPGRADNALDSEQSDRAPQPACAVALDPNDVCRSEISCSVEETCGASFEWMWSSVELAGTTNSLELRDISGDGTVVLGDWVTSGAESARSAFVWRWGKTAITLLPTSEGNSADSSATALNFAATAATGAEATCSNCSYAPLRWTSAGAQRLPDNLGFPSDISDALKVVGYARGEDGVLWGYMWEAGDAVMAEDLALQNLSGDGVYAAGVTDGGPVVRFSSSGTTTIPTTDGFRPDITLAMDEHGALVVGYGWDSSARNDPMFRWYVNESRVDIVSPLPGFTEVVPFSLNARGSVMVGVNRNLSTSSTVAAQDVQAFYWDEALGLRPLTEELASRGLTIPDTMFLHDAYIAADGTTIVGKGVMGDNPILWRARLSP